MMVGSEAFKMCVKRFAFKQACARISHQIAQRADALIGSAAAALAAHGLEQPA